MGTSPTTFSLNKTVTRGETAALIDRALNVNNQNFNLTVMHTNDTHGRVEMAPKRATAVKEIRANKPNALLVDAGDVFSGTLYFNEFVGQADVEFMNYMGYDAMTFGNHEFDLGSSQRGIKHLWTLLKLHNSHSSHQILIFPKMKNLRAYSQI